MDALVYALRFVNLVSAALVMGGQIYVLLVIVPTKRAFATRTSVEVHNAMLGHQTDRYMKPSGIVSGLTAVLILILQAGLPAPAVASMVVGLVGTAGVVVTSRYYNVRTNAMMAGWSLDAIPAEYPDVRAHWDRVHAIRASCGALGFCGYLAGLILSR